MGKLKFRNVKFGRRNSGSLMAAPYNEVQACLFISVSAFFVPISTIIYANEIYDLHS
jgi:hypothetical protein